MAEYIEKESLVSDLCMMAKYQTAERQQSILGCVETIRMRRAADVAPVRYAQWIPSQKHIWSKYEDGTVDELAWDYGYCNGPACTLCGYTFCVHCNERELMLAARYKRKEESKWDDESCTPHFICSNCGRVVVKKERYCPNCGGKMEEE